MKENILWTIEEANSLFKMPFIKLIFKAQKIHRKYFNPYKVQISTLLSIKTGACPEDCKYCPQSARYNTKIKKENLIEVDRVIHAARKAKKSGSTRFCMGAAWKNPNNRDMPILEKMVKRVKSLGLETCMTLGMLSSEQAKRLASVGLDYYNHNLDTSSKFYKKIVTTRKYEDRLNTINKVRKSGIKVCCGGIIGLGENRSDRVDLLVQLANLSKQPESVPINMLVKVKGTPLANTLDLVDSFEFIRTIAVARIMMPKSYVRLSAGRETMNDEMQALSFISGANSLFFGCKLLTTDNPTEHRDIELFKKLGINIKKKKINKNYINENIKITNNILYSDNKHYYNAEL